MKFRERDFPNFLFFIIFIITATTNIIIKINASTSISIINKNKVEKIARKKIIKISLRN